jgi:hypothetical protein
MIALIFFVLIAVALLFMLGMFLARPKKAEQGAQALLDARNALQSLQDGLLPSEMVGRLFSSEDLEFVNEVGAAPVRELFLGLRKRIALHWVQQVRWEVIRLKEFHFGRSRHYARLNLSTEISLALSFGVLLAECRALQLMIYSAGPYAAPRLLGWTASTAGKVCAVSEKSLGFLELPGLGGSGEGSPGNPASA